MALTKCPDCGADISDLAPACIKCGRPMAEPDETEDDTEDDPLPERRIQTIEATSKTWKTGMLAGMGMMTVGFFLLSIAQIGPGMAVGFVGFIVAVGSRMAAWWENG
jgi:hypothetical protein